MYESLNEAAKAVHKNARNKGWWDGGRQFTDVIALIHSEVSEALDEYRNGHEYTEIYYIGNIGTKPEGVPIEMADIILRVLDFCGHAGIDIEEALRLKMAYNDSRPFRHGGKRA